MAYQSEVVNQEALRTLLEEYLGPLPEEYQHYLLQLLEGQIDILIHNLLQEMVRQRSVSKPGGGQPGQLR